MKKVLCFIATAFITVGSCMAVFAGETTASRTPSKVLVDNKETKFDSYLINDNNYFKLRDIAYILNGTDRNFSVDWKEDKNSISINTKTAYVPMGGEMNVLHGNESKVVTKTLSTVYVDNKETKFDSYLIDGNNYFKLRELGEALNFGVDFDEKSGSVIISGTENYYDINPVLPIKYQSILGTGFDVNWERHEEGNEKRTFYSTKAVKEFKEKGVSHVRIRLHDDMTKESFELLDKQLSDCIKNGIIPVIAYAADDFKANPSDKTIKKVTDWWKTMAEHCKDKSYLISFNLLIECGEEANDKPELLNALYESCVTAIRETNPERIIIISPRMTSNPYYLNELKIPTKHNGYLMGEWHFYAAGPKKEESDKQWTTGTDTEKKYITDKIKAAKEWEEKTGIPTWVGAWMPANYNKDNEYTVTEQIVFAKYMLEQLDKNGIPSAINSDSRFYNHLKKEWDKEYLPLVDAMFIR